MQWPDFVGALDLTRLDRLPDSPRRDAELGRRLLDQHVITLHRRETTEKSTPIIDYSAGQFHFVPCIIIQWTGEKGGTVSKSARQRQKWRVRFQILERDNFRCHYCGTPASETKLVIDHVVPLAKGGEDRPRNMCAACPPCNGGKSDILLEIVA